MVVLTRESAYRYRKKIALPEARAISLLYSLAMGNLLFSFLPISPVARPCRLPRLGWQ